MPVPFSPLTESSYSAATNERRMVGKNSRKVGWPRERREQIMIERQTRYRARKTSASYSIDELARRSGAKRLDSSFAFSLDDDGDDASVWPV